MNEPMFPMSAPHRVVQLVDAAELAILKQQNPNGDRNPSPGDPCGRSCEGTAYRIEARSLKAELERANLLIEQQAKRIAELDAKNTHQSPDSR